MCLTREQLDNIVRVFQKYDKGTAAIAKTDLVPLCRVRVSGGSASFSLLEGDTRVQSVSLLLENDDSAGWKGMTNTTDLIDSQVEKIRPNLDRELTASHGISSFF